MDTDAGTGRAITRPARLTNFAAYFKNYMGLSAVFIAALPIPVTQIGLIPVVPEDKGIISTLTSIICFILIAFVFSVRRSIAVISFRESWPGRSGAGERLLTLFTFVLVLAAVFLFFEYHRGVSWYFEAVGTPDSPAAPISRLRLFFGLYLVTEMTDFRTTLVVLYASFFACVSSAFVLLAIKEYMQDVLGLDDATMIRDRIWAFADSPAPGDAVSGEGSAAS